MYESTVRGSIFRWAGARRHASLTTHRMTTNLPTHKDIAEFFRLALLTGLCAPAAAAQWADTIVSAEESPDIAFIELCCAGDQPVSALLTPKEAVSSLEGSPSSPPRSGGEVVCAANRRGQGRPGRSPLSVTGFARDTSPRERGEVKGAMVGFNLARLRERQSAEPTERARLKP